MGTKFAAVVSNLIVGWEETKMFALVPQDFVFFFIRNHTSLNVFING